jgi:hypothetical protein
VGPAMGSEQTYAAAFPNGRQGTPPPRETPSVTIDIIEN